jgi:methyl-accepting chemotaxis protein
VRIEHLHQSFHDLLEQEARLLKSGQPYAQSRYQQERTKLLDSTLRELARLKDQLEKTVHDKLEGLGSTARAARNIALATTIILLFAGTVLSLKISTSVAKPLEQLTSLLANDSVSEGDAARSSSIPEIRRLAEALSQHRQRFVRAAATSANDMERATEDLVSRVASLKRQLADLKVEIASGAPPEIRAFVDSLIAETDRLVQHCAELNASVAARSEVMMLPIQTGREREADLTSVAANAWLLRELPASQSSTANKIKLHAARGANIVSSLLRQLRR